MLLGFSPAAACYFSKCRSPFLAAFQPVGFQACACEDKSMPRTQQKEKWLRRKKVGGGKHSMQRMLNQSVLLLCFTDPFPKQLALSPFRVLGFSYTYQWVTCSSTLSNWTVPTFHSFVKNGKLPIASVRHFICLVVLTIDTLFIVNDHKGTYEE